MKYRFLHNVFLVAVAWVILGTVGPALAASPTAVNHDAEATMRVGAVNPERGYAVLDDRIFLISAATRVTRASGATGSLTDLRKGTYVTIRTTTAPGANKPTLTEIRIAR